MKFLPAAALMVYSAAVLSGEAVKGGLPIGRHILEPLQAKDLNVGSGCLIEALQSGGKRVPILVWGIGEKAAVRLDGRVRSLIVDKEDWNMRRVGQDATFALHGDAMRVEAKVKSIFVCPKDSSSCEETRFSGTMKLSLQNVDKSFPILLWCGS